MASKYAITFAQNLRALMKEHNLTNTDLSKKVGITNQAISNYLNCKREITLECLCKIADYFNEEIDILIGRKEF